MAKCFYIFQIVIIQTIFLLVRQVNSSQEISLIKPKVTQISVKDVESLPQETLFCWCNTKMESATFLSYDHGVVGFCKVYIDNLPEDLSVAERASVVAQPISANGELHTAYLFSFGTEFISKIDIGEYIITRENSQEEKTGCNDSYYLSTPLNVSQAMPQKITVDGLCFLLESRRFIFYTGAGLSADSGVSTMIGLEASLGLNKQVAVDSLTHAVLQEGEKALNFWKLFCDAMFNARPTKAHIALAKIALEKNVMIFTENFDYLHERSGIMPVRPTKQTVLKNIRPSDLEQLEAIVCIGLGRDDKGFLAYYKLHNPGGIIISIDLKQPLYLNSKDYFLEGDLQKVVLNMSEKMI